MTAPPPPPRRSHVPSRPETPELGWKGKMKARGSSWGKAAIDKSVVISDSVGGRVNSIAEKRFGTHAFWPVTGDFGREMDKCAQILREFTVDGIVTQDKKTKRKVLRKIPPSVIANAKGLAIFTSMRSGIAPLGGAGGAGVVVGRLEDGSWSAPASISPNNLSTGFLIGIDVYDCVLVIRTQKALDSFGGHKVTIGSEIGVAAGPYGVGAAVEAGKEKAAVFSYIKSRGMYAGLEVVGQVFVSRYEENGLMYHWPGIKAKDILEGKVPVPLEGRDLMRALEESATGVAQKKKGEPLDVPIEPEVVAALDLEDGEVLKLPPTPDMTDGHEGESDSETERVVRRSRPPLLPPRHGHTASLPPPLPPRNPGRATSSARPSLDLIDLENGSHSEPPSPTTTKKELLGDSLPVPPPRSQDRPASVEVFPAPDGPPPSYTPPVEGMHGLGLDDKKHPEHNEHDSGSSSYGSALASPERTGNSPAIRHVDSVDAAPATPADSMALHIPPASTSSLEITSPPGIADTSSPAIRHIDPLAVQTPPVETPEIQIPPAPSSDLEMTAPPTEGMSEGERREWEQHLAQQKEESLR